MPTLRSLPLARTLPPWGEQVYKGLYHGVQPVAVKVLHADPDHRVVEEFVREVRAVPCCAAL